MKHMACTHTHPQYYKTLTFPTAKKKFRLEPKVQIPEPCPSVKHDHHSTQNTSDKTEFVLTETDFFPPQYIICQVTLSLLPLLHNHIMEAPDVIHVHKRADSWPIRDLFPALLIVS